MMADSDWKVTRNQTDADFDNEFWTLGPEPVDPEPLKPGKRARQEQGKQQGNRKEGKHKEEPSSKTGKPESQPRASSPENLPLDLSDWQCSTADLEEGFLTADRDVTPRKVGPDEHKGPSKHKMLAQEQVRGQQVQAQRNNTIREFVWQFLNTGQERLEFSDVPGVDGKLNDADCHAVRTLCDTYFGSHGLQLYDSGVPGQGEARKLALLVPPSRARLAAASSSSSTGSSSTGSSRSKDMLAARQLVAGDVRKYREQHEVGFFKNATSSTTYMQDDRATSVALGSLANLSRASAAVILTCWLSQSWLEEECMSLLGPGVDAVLVHGAAGTPSFAVSEWFSRLGGCKVAVRPTDRFNKGAKPDAKGSMHHSKGFIVFFRDTLGAECVRVIITSANLSQSDTEYLANGWWFQDFPLKVPGPEASSFASAPKSEFEYGLTMYLEHVLHADNVRRREDLPVLAQLGSCKRGLVYELSRYDFSGARAQLVMSIPHHAGTGAAMLERLLPPRKETESLPLVMQASSIGSQGPAANFVTSFLAAAMGQPNDNPHHDLIHVVWPATGPGGFYEPSPLQEVGTMFAPLSLPEYVAMSPYFTYYRAAAKYPSRKNRTPHIKTYAAFYPKDPRRLKWCILTSANLSQMAWGMLRNDKLLAPMHYEMGVYFEATEGRPLVTHDPVGDEVVLPLGYSLGTGRYDPKATPWGMDYESSRQCKWFDKKPKATRGPAASQAERGEPAQGPASPSRRASEEGDMQAPACAFSDSAAALAAAAAAREQAQAHGPGELRRRGEARRRAAQQLLVLSAEQLSAVELAKSGVSFFFTGAAGTGKSSALCAVVAALEDGRRKVALTASTGAAAALIGGSTLHSWAGCGLAREHWETHLGNMPAGTQKRWRDTDVLIIDEISMVGPELFEKLEALARALRNSAEPFGGIQVIASGDFLQLPPVREGRLEDAASSFAFGTAAWKNTIKATVLLTTVHRQHERELLDMLSCVRRGELTDEALATIKDAQRHRLEAYAPGVKPTTLYVCNIDVDEINAMELAKLREPQFDYKAQDTGAANTPLEQTGLPGLVSLRVGAQVRYTINTPKHGLVNGSRGVVLELPAKPGGPVIVQFLAKEQVSEVVPEALDAPGAPGAEPLAGRSQYPLRLAWAATIHRSQGMTLDLVHVDLAGCFEVGMAYTALSRCATLRGLSVANFDSSLVKTSVAARAFEDELRQRAGQPGATTTHHAPCTFETS
jgi:hypothetical protein